MATVIVDKDVLLEAFADLFEWGAANATGSDCDFSVVCQNWLDKMYQVSGDD